jgi:phosphate/sulfate permease
MASIYVVILLLIFSLSISDLNVGFFNNVTNFLGSAIGKRAISGKSVIFVAGLGLLTGAFINTGMTGVVRQSIFLPQYFTLSEVMFVFLAVMIADVILLELFNTHGLPASTTVSLVLELLGASLGISIFKLSASNHGLQDIGMFINSGRDFAIISAILLSVMIAMAAGILVQYIIRLLFTFHFNKTIKFSGPILGSISVTLLFYVVFIKNISNMPFIGTGFKSWIEIDQVNILIAFAIILFIIFQIVTWIFRADILKILVFTGIFFLTVSFVGNGLSFFTGIPLAAFDSIKNYLSEPGNLPSNYLMNGILQNSSFSFIFLFISCLVLFYSLLFSGKGFQLSNSVLTEKKKEENTDSAYMARVLVRKILAIGKIINQLSPDYINSTIKNRFRKPINTEETEENSFDLLRVIVNLFLASFLISSATLQKLPVSAVYITFMISVGTSLADRTWNRENAVQNLSKLITIIGSWFFSALCIFTITFIIVIILFVGKVFSVLLMIALSIFLINRILVSKRRENLSDVDDETDDTFNVINNEKAIEAVKQKITSSIIYVSKIYFVSIHCFLNEKVAKMKKLNEEQDKNQKDLKVWRYEMLRFINNLPEDSEVVPLYIQALDQAQSLHRNIYNLYQGLFDHLDNNFPVFPSNHSDDLKGLTDEISSFFNYLLHISKSQKQEDFKEILTKQLALIENINKLKKKQLKSMKKGEMNTKSSLLYLDLLSESATILNEAVELVKIQKFFK